VLDLLESKEARRSDRINGTQCTGLDVHLGVVGGGDAAQLLKEFRVGEG
jgi:hypothetical protein